MALTSSPSVLPASSRCAWVPWLPIIVGLAALYLPTFAALAGGAWTREEHMHGPIVLVAILWLAWRLRAELVEPGDSECRLAGSALVAIGLALYVLGRSQDIIILEVGSLVPVLAGALLFIRGRRTLRRFWFPLVLIGFMLPLPGFIVDALTGPLKQQVTAIAEEVLNQAGYPTGRSGVILNVGPYQLLVADACSGLHSLVSIASVGLVYIYLLAHRSRVRNAILVASLLPIGFVANIVRVIVLVLVTYHWGDEAGQGFIHGFSGIFLFAVGLLTLFGIDALVGRMRWLSDTAETRA